MNILVVNGSPHPGGNSARLAAWLLEELRGGAEVVDLYAAGIGACRGCRACGGIDGCVLPDGMRESFARLARADCLVLASPVHFSSLSGPMVSWISRLQPLWPGADTARQGVGVLLISGGAEYGGMFEPARKVAAAAFRTLGRNFSGMVSVANTDSGSMDEPEARRRVRELAEKVKTDLGHNAVHE